MTVEWKWLGLASSARRCGVRFLPYPKGASLPVVQLVGPDRLGKQLISFEASAAWGRALYRGAAEALPGSITELDDLARIWERECRLMPLALYLDAEDLDPPGSEMVEAGAGANAQGGLSAVGARAVLRLIARTHRLVFLSVRERWARPGANH